MNSKTIILSIALCYLAVATADPIPWSFPSLEELNQIVRKPVGKCPSKDGAIPVYLPDADDCSIFYECSAGEAVPKECMTGLCFDSNLNVCAFPPKKLSPVDLELNQIVRKPVGKCPSKDGAIPVYLPDADDCSIFYECSAGEAVPKECMTGLCFDSNLNVCAFPPKKLSPVDLDDVKFVKPFDAVGDCPPRDTNETVYLPDNKNCSLYYICSNGKPIQNVCPPDMSWNNVKHICDWDLDANCKQDDVKFVKPFDAVGDCPPRDTNETVYLPDNKNCSLYYICSNGKPIQNVCPPDMSWNNVKHICDWDLDADCSHDNGFKSLNPFDAVGDCPPRDTNETVYLPDNKNCSLYYICSNGKPIQNVCPPDMSWNNVKHICDWDLDADCSHDSIVSFVKPFDAVGDCPPRDTNVTVYLPDNKNCSLYYICSNGHPIQNVCPPDMSWNNEKHICDWDLDANCQQTRKAVGTCPSVDPANPVYLPDSDDCTIYYECSDGVAIPNECPPDLEFNPILRVCDFPLDAGCSIPNNSTATPEPPATTTEEVPTSSTKDNLTTGTSVW